ncbi:alpha-L-rhamnosidase [Chitinophaga silvatica]|uniref:alpha-L-rhamnosidase n=1 Tax=Chitinophaga silvatica TaxID=2282649 RepID=A0A3E1Y3T8_9BACT|nr:family 78 glycoside hydrolase catalytic domain [Chitinophaga silvatica]RFS19345.1 alpha-L-rhamnosidase [Chitinophaga silvatica]
MRKLSICWLLLLLCQFALAAGGSSVLPQHLRCEYLINPTGIDELKPRLSWTLKATDTTAFAQRQTAYCILVASSEEELKNNKGNLWSSGWINSADMQHIVYKGKPLESDKRYYWKVCVKDEKNMVSAWSPIAVWATGLLKRDDWKASWIGSDEVYRPGPTSNISYPWFRKTFELTGSPQTANIFVASVGYHEVYVNGYRVGEDVLAPAVTDHAKRARYVTYDIARFLKPGKNVIGLWLGTSWSIFGPYITPDKPNTPIVMAQANIYTGASNPLIIKTDDTWKTHPSPNMLLETWDFARLGGEQWDANKEISDWNTLSCNEQSWKQATVYHPQLILSAQMVEPNRVLTSIKPVSIEARADGSYRVDMGVNFAGWTSIKLKGQPGDKITFQYSEREQMDMTFNLHSAYIIGKEGKGTFKNRFNYSSGRWITIKGLSYKPSLDDIEGWLVRTNYESATSFKCSDSLQNWMYDRIRWTYENLSLGGYVVDCPQRERLGYGGDAHATCETGMFNYHLGAFYTKWLEDWRDVQGTESIVGNMYDTAFAHKAVMSGRYLHKGILPHTAPTFSGGGGPSWGGIVVSLPWYVYQQEGDKRILEKNFEMITLWLEFLDTQTKDNLLQRFGGKWDFLGDWLWPNATAEGMNNDSPQTLCLNNSYRVYNLRTAAKIARVLGNKAKAEEWEKKAKLAAAAIHNKFYNEGDDNYSDGSMANLAAALLAEIPPANIRPLVMKQLENDILVKYNGHIHVGITGGALLFKLLRDEGRDDLIYSMTSQTTYPSWGYMKANGATTIWEMWEKDLPGHSLLHSSYLYPGAWYINGVAGIRQDPSSGNGYRKFIVRPPHLQADQISWANTSYESSAGTIKTDWHRTGQQLVLKVTIPPNCTATIDMPEKVLMNGQVLKKKSAKGYELPAGSYILVSEP